MKLKNSLLLIFMLVQIWSYGQNIWMDGDFEDWTKETLVYSDPLGDGKPNGVDFQDIYIDSDKDYIYISIDLNKEILIQNNNNLTLLIDSDNNLQTGKKINGIGCELRWDFGARSGKLYTPSGQSQNVAHYNIGIITAPTVSGDRIELLLDRSTRLNGTKIFASPQIAIRIEDNSTQGDDAPNGLTGISYTLNNEERTYITRTTKKDDKDIRLLSLNSERDQLQKSEAQDAYRRLFKALDPDIIAFQELYNMSAAQVKNRIQGYTQRSYFAQKVGSDLILLSRYPIIASKNIGGNALHIVELPNRKILISNNHFYCCDNDSGRQQEADMLMSTIRAIREGASSFDVPRDIPLIITGDLNLVGNSTTLRTLIEGDIVNNSSYGEDFNPDSDGSPLTNSSTYTLGAPSNYTWYKESENYSPGKLDYFIYSDHSITMNQSYALDTRRLQDSKLSNLNMRKGDSRLISDHLPIIFDFDIKPTNVLQLSEARLGISPNPNKGYFTLDTPFEPKKIEVIDLYGRIQPTSTNGRFITIRKSNPGIYILKVYDIRNTVHSKKFTII